jgi:hypothetical protein
MAAYNTFNLVDTKTRRTIITTSSARKCKRMFQAGMRIDVWSSNKLIEKIYNKNINNLYKYIQLEKQYIGEKQRIAHEKKERRRQRLAERMSLQKAN